MTRVSGPGRMIRMIVFPGTYGFSCSVGEKMVLGSAVAEPNKPRTRTHSTDYSISATRITKKVLGGVATKTALVILVYCVAAH